MKVFDPTARLGRFLVLNPRSATKDAAIDGSMRGFDSYEAADTYRKSLKVPSGDTVLIVQVAGEWRYHAVPHEVHPKG